jgi:hypothetical protein
MRRFLLSILLLLFTACAVQAVGKTLVLPYNDFGPPSAAHEVIGMDWWQWLEHGDSRPRRYDIKVVVYRDTDRDRVQRSFPLDPSQELDYRYLEYSDAIRYLDRMIEENVIDSLTPQLQSTRERIFNSLGEPERRER